MADLNKDIAQMKRQVGKPPEELTVGVWEYLEDIWVEEGTTKITSTNIAGEVLIWNHAIYGIWNSYKWGGTASSSRIYGHVSFGRYGTDTYGIISGTFILGNTSFGILGSSRLGTTGVDPVLLRVLNPSNTFRERFRDNDFEHSNTTATWDTTNYLAYFGDSEVLETEIFALNEETYSTGKVALTGSAIDNLTLELQFDGTNWESVTNNVEFTSSNASTSGIKFRATAGTSHSNKFALSFPISFAGTDIRLIKIEYS